MANTNNTPPTGQGKKAAVELTSEPIRAVLDALASLSFGAIQLTVHDGKLVQVDITKRKRFSN